MRKISFTILFIAVLNLIGSVKASEKVIFKIDIKKDIGSTTWLYIQKGFEEALEKEADVILIHMNTYGGEVAYADSIRTKILNASLPVYVFIDNNAASAGALISIACDKIFMRPGASIGAATVVNQTGEQMPDKYQSYMRATMRATAEAQGRDTIIRGNDTIFRWKRDPLIAEAMVDERTVVPNLIDSGKTLTFTALEAQKYGYCEGIAASIDELITENLGIESYKLINFRPTVIDNIKGFLMSSVFQGILIMLIIGGIYFELQTPGVGFPLAIAITAALLYFAPLYIEGLAANWEILMFIIGLILLVLEIFVIPGFGIAGISGIVLIIAGLTLSLLENVNFDFKPVETGGIGKALLTVTAGITLGFALVLYLSAKIGTKGLLKNIALNTNLEKEAGYVAVPMEHKALVGKRGTARTDLRPSGKVSIEGSVYDAVSESGFISKDTAVEVIRYEMGQLYVLAIPQNP
ncbi:MAG: NfeD family protein [Paludibacter sp.]|nr:NfeD family protein [Paludibacter sp.]MDD4198801.1 NfeD family protein [Paludibacter sp.]MDD4427499.1 NfeD family protein [Paludibacter sp.]